VGEVAADYDADTGGRVLVVDRSGKRLVDSAPTGSRYFSSRPEITAALAGEVATGTRPSATLDTDLLYVAVPVASSGIVHGAVRITYPTSAVESQIHRYWSLLAGIAAVVLALTAALAPRPSTRPPPSSMRSFAPRTPSSPTLPTSCARRSPLSASGSRTSTETSPIRASPNWTERSPRSSGSPPSSTPCEAHVEPGLAALATPGHVEQVLDNLLANALDVAPAGTAITLTADASDRWAELHVTDQGPGMRPAARERAFDRFWRDRDGQEGFGLGLAIVERLVTADGGEVELRQARSGGVDAVVRLPRISDHTAAARLHPSPSSPVSVSPPSSSTGWPKGCGRRRPRCFSCR
jgi:hypothetical protein